MSTETGNTLHLDEDGFRQQVKDAQGLAVVDFWAEWCQPCKVLGPTIDKLADDYKDRVTVAKVDIDSAQSVAMEYGVTSIPTVLVFKNGEVVDKTVGVVSEDALKSKIDAQL